MALVYRHFFQQQENQILVQDILVMVLLGQQAHHHLLQDGSGWLTAQASMLWSQMGQVQRPHHQLTE